MNGEKNGQNKGQKRTGDKFSIIFSEISREKNVLFHAIIRKRTIFTCDKSIKNVLEKKRVLKN
jgi:hypothetical protein